MKVDFNLDVTLSLFSRVMGSNLPQGQGPIRQVSIKVTLSRSLHSTFTFDRKLVSYMCADIIAHQLIT